MLLHLQELARFTRRCFGEFYVFQEANYVRFERSPSRNFSSWICNVKANTFGMKINANKLHY